MNLFGGLSFNGDRYFIMCKDNKTVQEWYVLDRVHADDRVKLIMGEQASAPPLTIDDFLKMKVIDKGYVIEGIKRLKAKGTYSQYGNLRIITKILENIGHASAYSFKLTNIVENRDEVGEKGKLMKIFKAYDNRLNLERVTEDGSYSYLNMSFADSGFTLQLRSDLKGPSKVDVDLVEVNDIASKKKIGGLSVKTITMDTLRTLTDLSWYEDPVTLECKKDYRVIETIEDFEKYVIADIIREYKACRLRHEKLVLALDTETTGFNMYKLSKENPSRDHVVAVPLSWKDDQGVVVFIDMEYFDNVPADYFFERIRKLVEGTSDLILDTGKESVPFTLQARVIEEQNEQSLNDLQVFLANCKPGESAQVSRTNVILTGHNVMFDGCALMSEGVEPYWDDDSLQMAFDLNPKVVKGKIPVVVEEEGETPEGIKFKRKVVKELAGGVALKGLTRRAFGHETPELSDILGKGNEDKYRYLRDKNVAKIYGCADADYSRQMRKFLMNLMTTQMYNQYKKQDVPMLNILYKSQFDGLFMNEEAVKDKAQHAREDREVIKKFLWSYIGRKIDFKSKYDILEVKYRTDQLAAELITNKYNQGEFTEEEYNLGLNTLYTKEKFLANAKEIIVDTNAEYQFEMKGSDYRKVMYDILKYPIYAYTKDEKNPQPSTDKNVMKKLMRAKAPHHELAEDVLSSDGKTVLIEAKEFNQYRYPVAYVLSIYGALNKEYTSYFKPIEDNNLEGRLFKNYSMARIETRRIMNPSQTMKGSLKALTLAYNWGEDWYMFDFDMAQVEYRIMVSKAGQIEMVIRLRDPEKDFHTESASALSGIPAHKIEKKFRKKMKAVHFGIPYGLGDHSMCESMNGTSTPALLVDTRILIDSFKKKNDKVIADLEKARDDALTPDETLSDEFKRFAGYVDYTIDEATGEVTEHLHKVGKVANLLGFYRLFDLENLDNKTIASIRRMAGNYPIQSFAAELFRIILIRFYRRTYREGIVDKIKWHLLIHDELLASAHKSIHPFFLYKLIKEECMITFKGHTKYFVGINIGENWEQCKDDASEAPVLFVDRMVTRWDAGEFKDETWIDNPREYTDKYKHEFIRDRLHEVLSSMQVDLDVSPIDCKSLFDNFENYTVRGYLMDNYIPKAYLKANGKPNKEYGGLKEERQFEINMTEWANDYYKASKSILAFDGHIFYSDVEATTFVSNSVDEVLDLDVFDYEEGGYWSFDNDSFTESSFEGFDEDCTYEDNNDYVDFERVEIDEDKVASAKTFAEMTKSEDANYVNVVGGNYYIKVNDFKVASNVKKYLDSYASEASDSVKVKFSAFNMRLKATNLRVDKSLDSGTLNKFIQGEIDKSENEKRTYKNLKIVDETVNVSLGNIREMPKDILGYLRVNKADYGYTVKFKMGTQIATFKHLPFSILLTEMDELVNKTVSLAITKTTSLKHIKDRGTYINIECEDDTHMEFTKRELKPYVTNSGKIIRFIVGNRSETWLKINNNADLAELERLISSHK